MKHIYLPCFLLEKSSCCHLQIYTFFLICKHVPRFFFFSAAPTGGHVRVPEAHHLINPALSKPTACAVWGIGDNILGVSKARYNNGADIVAYLRHACQEVPTIPHTAL